MKKVRKMKTVAEVCEMMVYQPFETAVEILNDHFPNYRLENVDGTMIIYDSTDSEVARICDDLEN